jgi:mycoredoxin
MNGSPELVLYGTCWCGDCRRVRIYLDAHHIPYRWIDVDQDEAAARFVEKVNRGFRSVPTIIWPDGSMLVEPSDKELALKLGKK